jgi:RNA polymerase sigma factor (sigma-70 family)
MDLTAASEALLRGAHPVTPDGLGCPPRSRPLDEVYLEHAPVMRRVIIRKFHVPPADADALVHDVFVGYLANPQRVRLNLKAYLVAGACNAARKYWRSKSYHERLFAEDLTTNDAAAADDTFADLARNLMVAATLARLGPRCQEALRRYYLDGEDTQTIATALNTSPANVNYIMHTCRLRAREIHEELSQTADARSSSR